MSVTLWLDTAAEQTIELGPTLPAYRAFAEMTRATGGFGAWQQRYPNLSGVLTQCETQEDAAPEWLAGVRAEAKAFLAQFGGQLGADANAILSQLAGQPSP